MQYEDNVQEWAGFCRETLNHFSENPIVPRPPEFKSNTPEMSMMMDRVQNKLGMKRLQTDRGKKLEAGL